MYQYNLRLGSAVLGLRVRDFYMFEWLSRYFMAENLIDPADMTIHVSVMRPSDVYFIPDSFFQSKRLNGKRFQMEGGLMRGTYYSNRRFIRMKVHPVMIETDASRVFEQCLYQIYYNMIGDKYLKAPLIHSSGVIRNGKGYIFLGPSEAGKSTVAELSSRYMVVNDEITIADVSGSLPMLQSTPFNGLYRDKKPGSAPLTGIFVLEKSSIDAVCLLDKSAAARPVADQIIPPVSILEEMKSDVYFKQLDIAVAINRQVPIYKLYFTKSDRFWIEIDKLETVAKEGYTNENK